MPKQFLSLKGRPVIEWSLSAFQSCEEVEGIILVVPEDFAEETRKRLVEEKLTDKVIATIAGGRLRQDSVARGLNALPEDAEWVAVHDAVRPFVTPQLIRATFTLAFNAGAAVPTVAIHDTLVQVDEDNLLVRAISREAVRRSQTPQIFHAEILADAHEKAAREGLIFNDDATLVAYYDHQVATFTHYGENRKITTAQDLEKITMQKLAKGSRIRCGQGFDAHPLEEGRQMKLAGVLFKEDKGSASRSDGDVICHAVCDALLGAATLGDIGRHFPSSDPAYEGVSGLVLLEETAQMVRAKGYEIVYIDCTFIGERPRVASRREEMSENLAQALSVDTDCISVKGASTKGLGFVGRGEGVSAIAMATLQIQEEESSP